MKIFKVSALSCAISSIMFPCLVSAQDDDVSLLEEIVVTAERRSQSVQDVPLSITAFGSEKRDEVGILSIQDMANFAPGVSYNTSTDRPSIRGIARESNTFTLDSPVANYIDGVFTSSVQDAQRRPIFIERTEILRGPQGALSGRGSIAGAFNTISKRPDDEFGFEVRTFAGDYARYGVEGTVTGPLTEWLRARLNMGSYHQDDGYFENISLNDNEGDQPNNREIVDLHLDANIGESIDLYLKAAWTDYAESRRSGINLAPFVAGTQGSPSPYTPDTSLTVPVAAYGYFDNTAVRLGSHTQNPAISGDIRQVGTDFKPTQELTDDYNNYTFHATYHAPGFDVKWILGHQDYTYEQVQDADGTDVVAMTLPGFSGRVVNPGGTNTYMEDRHWKSHELTFTSTTDSDVQWIFGLFQSTENTIQEPFTLEYAGYDELATPFTTINGLLAAFSLPFDANDLRAVVPNALGNVPVFGEIVNETVSTAVFGQVDWTISDELKLTLGLRTNKDEKEATERSRIVGNNFGDGLGAWLASGDGALAGLPAAFGTALSVDASPVYDPNAPLPKGVVVDHGYDAQGNRWRDLYGEWKATTGSLGIDFTPADDLLIYARMAAGYRPGGFNAGFINSEPQVDEETVYSYELGYKSTIMDRLQLSSSVFYYDFRDNQQPLPVLGRCTIPGDLSSCSIVNSFVNLPKSRSVGLEVELDWAPTDNSSVYMTYGYLDAKVVDGLPDGAEGYSNPDDPAAIFDNANRYAPIAGQFDSLTGLQRYTQDISGNSLRNSPKQRLALNGRYNFDFDAGNLVLSASWVWRDEAYSDLFESELAKVPSFSTLGMRALWTDADNRYTVIVYGNNLTDERAADAATLTRQRTGLAGTGTDDGTGNEIQNANGAAYYKGLNLVPPREWGIEFQYRYGG